MNAGKLGPSAARLTPGNASKKNHPGPYSNQTLRSHANRVSAQEPRKALAASAQKQLKRIMLVERIDGWLAKSGSGLAFVEAIAGMSGLHAQKTAALSDFPTRRHCRVPLPFSLRATRLVCLVLTSQRDWRAQVHVLFGRRAHNGGVQTMPRAANVGGKVIDVRFRVARSAVLVAGKTPPPSCQQRPCAGVFAGRQGPTPARPGFRPRVAITR